MSSIKMYQLPWHHSISSSGHKTDLNVSASCWRQCAVWVQNPCLLRHRKCGRWWHSHSAERGDFLFEGATRQATAARFWLVDRRNKHAQRTSRNYQRTKVMAHLKQVAWGSEVKNVLMHWNRLKYVRLMSNSSGNWTSLWPGRGCSSGPYHRNLQGTLLNRCVVMRFPPTGKSTNCSSTKNDRNIHMYTHTYTYTQRDLSFQQHHSIC